MPGLRRGLWRDDAIFENDAVLTLFYHYCNWKARAEVTEIMMPPWDGR